MNEKKSLNKMVIGKLNMSIGLMTVTPGDQLVLRWVACHMKRYVISWFFIRSLMFCVLQIWCSLLLNSSLYILEKEFHTLDSKVWKDMCQPKFAIYTVKSKMGPTILVFILLRKSKMSPTMLLIVLIHPCEIVNGALYIAQCLIRW